MRVVPLPQIAGGAEETERKEMSTICPSTIEHYAKALVRTGQAEVFYDKVARANRYRLKPKENF